MNESLIERGNSIPNLPLIALDDTYCEWESSCPRKYCDRGILRTLAKEKCLILERARYHQFVLTPYAHIKTSKITLTKKFKASDED